MQHLRIRLRVCEKYAAPTVLKKTGSHLFRVDFIDNSLKIQINYSYFFPLSSFKISNITVTSTFIIAPKRS